jgi:BlaI family penicillinase repressor
MRHKSMILTPQELEIMKSVWGKGEATVRDVYETLLEKRRIAYTTVMTMMNILEKKGYLKKRPEGRTYVYRSARNKEKVLNAMVREFVKRVFDGAAEPLLVRLIADKHLTATEIEDLARRVKEER